MWQKKLNCTVNIITVKVSADLFRTAPEEGKKVEPLFHNSLSQTSCLWLQAALGPGSPLQLKAVSEQDSVRVNSCKHSWLC